MDPELGSCALVWLCRRPSPDAWGDWSPRRRFLHAACCMLCRACTLNSPLSRLSSFSMLRLLCIVLIVAVASRLVVHRSPRGHSPHSGQCRGLWAVWAALRPSRLCTIVVVCTTRGKRHQQKCSCKDKATPQPQAAAPPSGRRLRGRSRWAVVLGRASKCGLRWSPSPHCGMWPRCDRWLM